MSSITVGCSKVLERLSRAAERWQRDTRGTSMITTAITLPVLIVVLVGVFLLYNIMAQKLALYNGVNDASHYISEYARYWNIDPTGRSEAPGDLLPADYYDSEARRLVESRLRDVLFYPSDMLTDSLRVWVEEPPLAYPPGGPEPIEDGSGGVLCDREMNQPGEHRNHENIRFRVMAEFDVPFWQWAIPYTLNNIKITLSERAINYVQCPRWRGKTVGEDKDKARWLASEGPFMNFRALSTPAAIPTVTGTIPPTERPTRAPAPTNPP